MNCKLCQSTNLIKGQWTKIISKNVYKLYDKFICKECKGMQIVDLVVVDKNTENTRKLLIGNYYVNKNGDVVPKSSEKKSLKELAREVQKEINVNDLFV